MGLSARALAEELKVSHTAVNKAYARGRISREVDGTFDLEKATKQWNENVDARQQERGLQAKPDKERPAVQKVPPDDPNKPTLLTLQVELDQIKIQRERLKLAEYENTLVKAEDVRAAQEARAQAEREALLNFPARVAPNLAAELNVDERTLHAALDKRIREFLRDRSRAPVAPRD